MKAESYTEALKHAWNITWRQKRLWVLGFLAAMISSGGAFEFVFKFFSVLGGDVAAPFLENLKLQAYMSSSAEGIFGWLLLLLMIVVTFLIVAAFIVLFVSGQGGLVYAVKEAEEDKKTNVAGLFNKGKKHLGTLFLINLLKAVIITVLLVLTSLFVVSFSGVSGWWTIALQLLFSIIIIVLGLMVSFLAIYSVCYVMLHEKKFKEALVDAWALFAEHWLVSLEMSVVIFFVGVVFAVVGLGVLMAIGAPVFIAFAFSAVTGNAAIIAVTFAIAATLMILMVFLLGAIYTTFAMSAWTVLFMEMDRKGFSSKTKHWLRKLNIRNKK